MSDAKVEAALGAVEAYLAEMTASDVDLLQAAGRHITLSGGKRVRPRLVLLSYLAAGGEALDDAVPMAAAVELVHTATLVHDDINDHSDTRRGRQTIHNIWDRTFALLTGDYLFAKVYQMMAPYGAAYNEIMAAACVALVEGETLQAEAAKAGAMDRETYKRIIERKTASLFQAGAAMGARLAGAAPDVVAALADYGRYLGLTFQIVDDILDIVGDPALLGKPVGADVAQQRGVMVAANGHAVAAAPADPVATMLAEIRESGAVDIARLQAAEMAGRARAALIRVPASEARDVLDDLIDQVLERQR